MSTFQRFKDDTKQLFQLQQTIKEGVNKDILVNQTLPSLYKRQQSIQSPVKLPKIENASINNLSNLKQSRNLSPKGYINNTNEERLFRQTLNNQKQDINSYTSRHRRNFSFTNTILNNVSQQIYRDQYDQYNGIMMQPNKAKLLKRINQRSTNYTTIKTTLDGSFNQTYQNSPRTSLLKDDSLRRDYELNDFLQQDKRMRFNLKEMTTDHTIQTTTLRKERLKISIERMKQKALKLQETTRELDKKYQLIDEYQSQFGVQLSPRELQQIKLNVINNQKLLFILQKRKENVIQDQAAYRIQRFFKRFKIRQIFINGYRQRVQAALKIQRKWKSSKWIRLIPYLKGRRRNMQAIVIQKYLRGYRARKIIIKQMVQEKIDISYNYFNQIKEKLYSDAQITIAYYWKRFKKMQLLEQERIQLEKQEQLKKSKKKGAPADQEKVSLDKLSNLRFQRSNPGPQNQGTKGGESLKNNLNPNQIKLKVNQTPNKPQQNQVISNLQAKIKIQTHKSGIEVTNIQKFETKSPAHISNQNQAIQGSFANANANSNPPSQQLQSKIIELIKKESKHSDSQNNSGRSSAAHSPIERKKDKVKFQNKLLSNVNSSQSRSIIIDQDAQNHHLQKSFNSSQFNKSRVQLPSPIQQQQHQQIKKNEMIQPQVQVPQQTEQIQQELVQLTIQNLQSEQQQIESDRESETESNLLLKARRDDVFIDNQLLDNSESDLDPDKIQKLVILSQKASMIRILGDENQSLSETQQQEQ
ncbi:UNKNOWN [Stylonychia lemnae]|uniref:Uncharacterized protein n=1 Tax=Stylonychia lemnae TaxID=5949 RepID=A0A078APW1_STYLE|nr:UNKNOWN [Stylonychia lemnae]|eukprot:CDW84016.1 UNKNOWN [Stylonychia lemnae]